MIKLFKTVLLCFLAVITLTPDSKASHISGGDISYTSLGQDSFLITLNLFRDCDGINMGTTENITLTSTCGGQINLTLQNVPNPVTGNAYTNISQLCAADSLNSTCFNGTLPGMQMYTYEAIVVLSPPCDTWTIGWSTCCRNNTVNVPTSNGDGVYLQATLNSQTAPTNSSPQFTSQPIPYVCINQPVSYNYGVVEPDGDSLVYSLIAAYDNATTNLVYGGAFSGASPIAGITIDPATGQLNFTPTTLGNFIVVVQVDEYDANGNLIGTVMRDIQFVVQNCTNQVPPSPVGASNVTGNAAQIGPLAVELCEGSNVCFDIVFDDPDPNDTLTFTTNLNTVLPGATMTVTGTNPATVSICWTALPNSPNFNAFTIDVNDGACPVAGVTTLTMEVHVITSTTAGPDQTICGTQVAQLNGNGGTIFNWSVLSGPPMTGANFSCNPCSNPVASPTATTTYVVTSDLSGNCVNTDTVTINVVPDFTWNVTQTSSAVCLLEDIDINVTPTPGGNYTYQWSPAAGLNDPTIPNPTASVITPGNNTYYLTMTSAQGCVLQDSVQFYVAPNYQPSVFAGNDTLINCGDSIMLNATLGATIPTTCGISTTGCGGAPTQLTVGTGTQVNTTTSYPAPYGNFYWGARHQILFQASELQAMGFNGGQITELALDVAQVSGATQYNSWEIRMGCTNTTSLNQWETGLVTVFPANNITVAAGWNTYTFANAFDWDGLTNIVVEICFNNSAWDDNSITRYTPTAFNSVLYYNADINGVCYSGNPTSSPNRPNVRFTTCDGSVPPGTYSYSWTPTTAMNDPSLLNPMVAPFQDETYIVTVTDNVGGCSDTDTVNIAVFCPDCLPAAPTGTNPTCNGASDGMIVATPNIVYNPVIFEWYDQATGMLLQTSQATNTNDTLTGIPAGTYIVSITDTALNCTEDTTITLVDPPIPTLVAGNDTTICENGTATMNALAAGGNGAPYTYNWSNGATGTGPITVMPTADSMIYVTAADTNGCPTAMDSVFIQVNPPLSLTTSGPDTICSGDIVGVSSLGTGGSGAGYTYSWEDMGNNVIGNLNAIDVQPPSAPYTYCVTISDNCETTPVTECLVIDYHVNPAVSLTSDIIDGCSPIDVNFVNTTPAAQVGSVVWDFGNGTTGTDLIAGQATYTTPGCYDVSLTVTSPEGCVSDTTYANMICAYGYPTAAFNFGPQPTTVINSTISFDNTSIDNAINWWAFDNGTPVPDVSDLEHPEYTFPSNDPGSYDVTLVVANADGCLDSITQTVVINGEYVLYVPNSFTPNNDGINDVFIPQGDGIDLTGYELLIFNRWGELVFQTSDASKGWDGTINGTSEAQMDTYVWKLSSRDTWTQNDFVNYGHVNVIR